MMMRLPMVSLAKSPAEVKADMPMAMPAASTSVNEYPYGCCISLDDECLKKLGLDSDMPSVGEMIHFGAIAKVTSASMHQSVDDSGTAKECRRIELQITDMGLLSAEPEPRAAKWYGQGEPDGDEG
jgi:hypothetical protein